MIIGPRKHKSGPLVMHIIYILIYVYMVGTFGIYIYIYILGLLFDLRDQYFMIGK